MPGAKQIIVICGLAPIFANKVRAWAEPMLLTRTGAPPIPPSRPWGWRTMIRRLRNERHSGPKAAGSKLAHRFGQAKAFAASREQVDLRVLLATWLP